jgi:starch phosphorylase
MKLAINGALTIGTEDGANIEMREAIGDRWWPFSFGSSSQENSEPYNPQEIYFQDEAIRRAVDTLKTGTFASNPEEDACFAILYEYLTTRDPYRILKDLRSYYETQQKVEMFFQQPLLWAETALHNIAGMGSFSSDHAIRNYAEKIWDIVPCPPDLKILEGVAELMLRRPL